MIPVDEKVRLTQQVLSAIMNSDADRASDLLADIGERATINEMYAFCCAFAHSAVHALELLTGQKVEDGMVMLQDLRPNAEKDPAETFAVRFITAYGNRDSDNTNALFDAATRASPKEYVESMAALPLIAGQWLKILEDQNA